MLYTVGDLVRVPVSECGTYAPVKSKMEEEYRASSELDFVNKFEIKYGDIFKKKKKVHLPIK